MRNLFRPLLPLTLLVILLLAGCAGLQPVQTRPAIPLAEKAASQMHAGDYGQAAETYRQAANQASEPARSQLLLRSAEAAIRSGNGTWAREMLAAVAAERLPQRDRKRYESAQLEARIAGRSPAEALQTLPPPGEETSPEEAARVLALRSDLLFATGDLAGAISALVQRDVWLLNGEALRENDERIWAHLLARPPTQEDVQATEDPVTRGWLELGQLSHRSWPSRDAFERSLVVWERRHAGHPASRNILAEKLNFDETRRAAAMAGSGGAIGLLLPLSGRLASVGRAIHDGFMAGYYASSGPRPEVIAYDSTRLTRLPDFLEQVRGDGVGFLVGPLRKDIVDDLVNMPTVGLPVLALNYSDSSTGGSFNGVYQFGLAPEDEARAAARRALAEGKRQAVAMTPNSTWGRRVYDAFAEELRAGGGEVFDYAEYDPDDKDFSDSIKRILRWGAATTSSRQTDFAFIAAKPSEARQIRTQLRYYRASHLPVYATSHVYDGREDVRLNRDLNGLRFPDMPWLLAESGPAARERDAIADLWPASAAALPRLVALGHDAWLLSDRLRNGGVIAGTRVDGYTGELSLDSFNRVHRNPMWAHFVGGKAELLPDIKFDTPADESALPYPAEDGG